MPICGNTFLHRRPCALGIAPGVGYSCSHVYLQVSIQCKLVLSLWKIYKPHVFNLQGPLIEILHCKFCCQISMYLQITCVKHLWRCIFIYYIHKFKLRSRIQSLFVSLPIADFLNIFSPHIAEHGGCTLISEYCGFWKPPQVWDWHIFVAVEHIAIKCHAEWDRCTKATCTRKAYVQVNHVDKVHCLHVCKHTWTCFFNIL